MSASKDGDGESKPKSGLGSVLSAVLGGGGVLGVLTAAMAAGWHPWETKAALTPSAGQTEIPGVGFRVLWLTDKAARYSAQRCVSDAIAVLSQAGFADPSMRETNIVAAAKGRMVARISCNRADDGQVFLAVGVMQQQDPEANSFLNAFAPLFATQVGHSFRQSP